MNKFTIHSIGTIHADDDGFCVQLKPEYIPALQGLDGFSHVQLLWWFDKCDNVFSRKKLCEDKPYTKGPESLGTFATRSPERPNPLALSSVGITYIDPANGIVGIDYIDADDNTPVIDIKPYTPSLDTVASAAVPDWCAHWPDCREKSGDFDWQAEFNF